MPEQFTLDGAQLRDSYVKAQQTSHPDRMIGKPDVERAKAIQHSMDVNEAFETLKDPLLRAQHLLVLQGIQVNTDDDSIKPSPELLMEAMEMREHMSGVQNERDAALLVLDVKKASDECTEKLTNAFEANDYTAAAQLTIRLRYLGKALEEAYMKQYQMKERGASS